MNWPWRKRQARSINDLPDILAPRLQEIRIADKRKATRIAVIDDLEFAPYRNLENHGYNLDHLRDIKKIQDLDRYQIVLCDLQGVGLDLNPQLQGAHIIGEIKKQYPEKYVVAYTGGAENSLIQNSIAQAHRYLAKDASIQEWCEVLDGAINGILDPVQVWKKTRVQLLEAGVTLEQLAKLEDSYVASFTGESNSPNSRDAFIQFAIRLGLHGTARSVLESLVSSGLYDLIKPP